MVKVSVHKALQYVADNPHPVTDVVIDHPVWELTARALYEIANSPNAKERGSMARATKAQMLILNRLVGTRLPGTHPAARESTGLEFVDLTRGVVE